MNSFLDDDIDDSLMLAALAQVESSFAAKQQQSASIATVAATTSVTTTPTSTLPRVVQPRSFENLTNQHIPRNCKCAKPATVKVVVKQGGNNGKRFYSCANQTCGFFDWVTAAHRLPPLAVSSTSAINTSTTSATTTTTTNTTTNTINTTITNNSSSTASASSALLYFEVVSDSDFAIYDARGRLPPNVNELLLVLPGSRVPPNDDARVLLPLAQYRAAKAKLSAAGARIASDLPAWVVDIFLGTRYAKVYPSQITVDPRTIAERVPSSLWESLFPFQRQGVEFAISRNGRCLIGDDMGLGKTVQAITVAAYFRADWPLLIFCPASMRVSWAEQLQRWLPDLTQDDIGIVWSASSPINRSKVVIVSYDVVSRMQKQLLDQDKKRPFHFMIADESHMLKNATSQRARAIVPMLSRARHAILLSGTAALSRPHELFTQLRVLDSRIFGSHHDFGVRYCEAYAGQFGWNYDGASHLAELNALLRATVMIRRLKSEVLSQLPEKTRRKALLHIPSKQFSVLKAVSSRLKTSRDRAEQRGLLLEMYADVGRAKLPSAIEYVREMLESDTKLLVFAHHKDVLDGFEGFLLKQNVGCIRIDGSTDQSKRAGLVEAFQSDTSDCRVALLSITAAGTGLTLTAARSVVFAELHWVPGQLRQCEDRAHRIGQTEPVDVRYLVAKDTMDEQMWSRLQQKLDVVGTALDGAGDHAMSTRDEERHANRGDSIASDDLVAEIVKRLETFHERDNEIRGRRDRRRARAESARLGGGNDDVNESDDSTLAESRANKRAHIMVPMDDMSDNDDEEIAMLLQRDRAPIDEHVFVDEEE